MNRLSPAARAELLNYRAWPSPLARPRTFTAAKKMFDSIHDEAIVCIGNLLNIAEAAVNQRDPDSAKAALAEAALHLEIREAVDAMRIPLRASTTEPVQHRTEGATMPERETAATRTRRVRKALGPGPQITSTPSSHNACVTTVITVTPQNTAETLKAAFPDLKVTESLEAGFVMLNWEPND